MGSVIAGRVEESRMIAGLELLDTAHHATYGPAKLV
jgi:hypothetical protein